jgi:hypothetical protein
MCLFAKRLERGRFVWPSTAPRDAAERTITVTPAQLGYLLEESIGGCRNMRGVRKLPDELTQKLCAFLFADSRITLFMIL